MSVLVLADHDQGALSPATARVVNGASVLGPIDLLVVGDNVGPVAQVAAQLQGVAKVMTASGTAAADNLSTLLAGLAGGYAYIIASAGTQGKDTLPRLAARLDLMPVTDITRVLGPNRFERPIYAGNARAGRHRQPVQACAHPARLGLPGCRDRQCCADRSHRSVPSHRRPG